MLLRQVFSMIFMGFFLLSLLAAQDIPASPCPDVFKYHTQANGNVYGRVTLPYDGSTTLVLGVNASMRGYYTDRNRVKLQIKMNTPGEELIEQRANTLSYDVYFPFQHTIPKITRIQFNNRAYCSGSSEEVVPGDDGVTTLWSGYRYYFQPATGNTFHGSSREPPQRIPQENAEPIIQHQRYPEVVVVIPPDNHELSFPDNSYPVVTTPKLPLREQAECGISKHLIVPLIVGGTEISDGEYPWLAAMFVSNGNMYEYKCTANLISKKHVVTAARCVTYFKFATVQPEDLLFIFGKTNLRNWATSGAVTRGASSIHTHQEVNFNSGHWDIAVITIDRPIENTLSVSPICLWEGDNSISDNVNKTGTVAGWGIHEVSSTSAKYSIKVAKSIEMPIVSQDVCLDSNFSFYQLTSDKTFCAGKRDGTGICIGDSGAAFMVNQNGKFYLRGIASIILSDREKCDLSNYMVFCDIAKVSDWIRESIRK